MCVRLVPRLALAIVLPLAACASHARGPTPTTPPRLDVAPDVSDLDQRIELLHALQAHGTSGDRARATFELAELYVDQAHRIDEARFTLDESRSQQPDHVDPALDDRDAELVSRQVSLFDDAARSYGDVLRSTDPIAIELHPQARHMLAYVQGRLGERALMLDTLRELVAAYPTHPLARAAWLMLADAAFDEQRFDDAHRQYEQVIRLDGPGRDHLYARYKLGWLAFNGDDAAMALEHWTAVVRGAGSDPVERTLADAAMKDCVLAYSRVGRPEAAKAFFLQIAPAHAPELLRALARRYIDDGRPEDAAGLGVPLPPM